MIELAILSIHWNFSSWCLLHLLFICQPAKVVPHSLQETLVIDHYYWSSLARTTQSYNLIDDPNIPATHSPVLGRMLLWTGRYLSSIQPSVWGHGGDLPFAIQAVVWDCKSWSRTLHLSLQFHHCPPPLLTLSIPVLMILWLLMALLQSYPSARSMPCPQNPKTLWSFFVSVFFQNAEIHA